MELCGTKQARVGRDWAIGRPIAPLYDVVGVTIAVMPGQVVSRGRPTHHMRDWTLNARRARLRSVQSGPGDGVSGGKARETCSSLRELLRRCRPRASHLHVQDGGPSIAWRAGLAVKNAPARHLREAANVQNSGSVS
jgi:hypothetical protein